MTLVGLWSQLVIASAAFYYAPSGAIEFDSVHDVVGIQTSRTCLEGYLVDAGLSTSAAESLWGEYHLVSEPYFGKLHLSALEQRCPYTKRLAVYRRFPNGSYYISDGLLRVRFNPRTSFARITSILDEVNAKGGKPIHRSNIVKVEAISPADALRLTRELMMVPEVQWAVPDLIYKKKRMWVPNDPWLSVQWHHDLIGAKAAWDLEKGKPEAIVAIIDSGVDMTHPDLRGKLVAPYDSLENDEDPSPGGSDAHGSACAGVVGAIGDNGEGIVGVCPGCSLMPIRIMSENGWGRYGADADAIRWAVDNGAQVLSNSWGHPEPIEIPANLEDAVLYAGNYARGGKGALLLFASGNDNRENFDYELASHPLVVSVGATTFRDTREGYSNYGPELDLVAPSASVTTDIQGEAGYNSGDYSLGFGGTSAAAPVASGVAGLMVSANLDLTREELYTILTSTADPLEEHNQSFHERVGHGRVNALRAVQAASGLTVCEPSFEDCSNLTDDDCDGLIDSEDGHCAPEIVGIGIPCMHDFQCGMSASCLGDGWGFPDGYCTTTCDQSTCPEGSICGDFRGNSVCFEGCETRDDCREGYDCLASASSETVCLPSCTVLGCNPGERCNEATGDCYHDGPGIPGAACRSSLECAMDGWCLREERFGIQGGFCGVMCDESHGCPTDFECVKMRYVSFCLEVCEEASNCREGFTCHPTEDDLSVGLCWESCITAGCEEGETCNTHGLCGDDIPPNIYKEANEAKEGAPLGPVQACSCDLTTVCDGDCSCDPECTDESGCSATGQPMLPLLMLLWLAFRRCVHRKKGDRGEKTVFS
uniref:Subtilisin-like serine proteases n=1 Tax=uncultured myxobacterium HF0200_19H16 TaxID=723559 RepID=E7C3W8_9BACT|nr:subtilisin-like serine proteases [uncultured myxobacterium HF0200_19H16]